VQRDQHLLAIRKKQRVPYVKKQGLDRHGLNLP
jgi:hypothetical protein